VARTIQDLTSDAGKVDCYLVEHTDKQATI